MSIYHPIAKWIKENMPELDEKLRSVGKLNDCRHVLNEVTGLGIKGEDPINPSLNAYSAFLKYMNNLKEAAKAVKRHEEKMALALARQKALAAEMEEVKARIDELISSKPGIEYDLWAAALGEVEPEPQE